MQMYYRAWPWVQIEIEVAKCIAWGRIQDTIKVDFLMPGFSIVLQLEAQAEQFLIDFHKALSDNLDRHAIEC